LLGVSWWVGPHLGQHRPFGSTQLHLRATRTRGGRQKTDPIGIEQRRGVQRHHTSTKDRHCHCLRTLVHVHELDHPCRHPPHDRHSEGCTETKNARHVCAQSARASELRSRGSTASPLSRWMVDVVSIAQQELQRLRTTVKNK